VLGVIVMEVEGVQEGVTKNGQKKQPHSKNPAERKPHLQSSDECFSLL